MPLLCEALTSKLEELPAANKVPERYHALAATIAVC
jgi:hypothetical protein